MHQFMCHKFLSFKFGPQINFIIGQPFFRSSVCIDSPVFFLQVTMEVSNFLSSPRLAFFFFVLTYIVPQVERAHVFPPSLLLWVANRPPLDAPMASSPLSARDSRT